MNEQVFGGVNQSLRPTRPLLTAMARGFLGRCPNCGKGRLFASYVKTVSECEHCGEAIHHHRADDLPAYLVVVIVGHVVLGAFMGFETMFDLSLVQQLSIWVPLTIVLAVGLLRPVKGAVVGLQWALYMHGFGGQEDQVETHPEA
jgi:uncharacterized protein (DUF983 family)